VNHSPHDDLLAAECALAIQARVWVTEHQATMPDDAFTKALLRAIEDWHKAHNAFRAALGMVEAVR
jgi:hypothetical protein